ncbi:hypothetical protein [Parvibaculum sp.]|uniref:hypothetical protein n=1 Tax=Parvibaculum sp. TaxID=2024848 RepID=UPI00391ACB26
MAQEEDGLVVSRLFRFGWLIHPEDEVPPGNAWRRCVATWKYISVDGLSVWMHPECSWKLTPEVLILGDAFAIERNLEETLAKRDWDNLSGRYVAITRGDEPYLQQDPFGSRSVFYREGALALSSHAELLGRSFGDRTNAAAKQLLDTREYKSRTVKYLPGDITMYDGVFGLAPNHRYYFRNQKVKRYWPLSERKITLYSEAEEAAVKYLSALASNVDLPILSVTGGIDCRLLLAGFLASKAPFRAVTWEGNWIEKNELPIVQKICGRFSLNHVWMPQQASADDPIALLSKRNSGGFRGPSRLSADMARNFSRGTFIRGYGGEIMRGFYNLRQNEMSGVTPEYLARLYNSSGKTKLDECSAYGRCAIGAFEGFIDRADYSDMRGYDVRDIFYWEHRMGMWGAAMLNEMDAAVYSISGLNSREMFAKALGMPPGERLNKEFLQKISIRIENGFESIGFV